jgi:hypothetical protein
MIKRDELENSQSCFNKAQDKERLFVMLARDPAAPVAIHAWITERLRLGKNKPEDDQIREALECAKLMEIERAEIRHQLRYWHGGCGDVLCLTISRAARLNYPPKCETLTWQQLAALFDEPQRTSCTVATCRGSSCPHKAGAWWSPAVFSGSTRAAKNVESVSCLVLDVDHASDTVVETMREQLAEYQHLIHVTHTDRPTARCLRVIVQLSRAVTPVEWPRFLSAAISTLSVPADLACSDIQRCYYLPSRPLDANYFAVVHAGESLNVDAVLAAAPAPTVQEGCTL